MAKLIRAWAIAKMCWNVLKLDKELVAFPLLSFVTCCLLLACGFGVLWSTDQLVPFMELVSGSGEDGIGLTMIAVDFAVFFIAYFVMIFFNSGLIACARIRFAGGDPTVADGLKASFARLPQIFAWALVTSIVGLILNRAANSQEGIGKFVIGLLGAGWTIASFFVVPALVAEKVGPVAALKRSVSIIRKTWGELLIVETGMSVLVTFILIPGFLAFAGGIFLLEFAPPFGIAAFALAALWVFTTVLVYSSLSAILRTALYNYATEGKIPSQFDSDIIQNPFEAKTSEAPS